MSNKQGIGQGERYIMKTYGRFPAVMVEGKGCWLTDADGKKYLDFVSGIAVCSLGHCYQPVTDAVCKQAAKLVHVSNLYYNGPQTELARLLVENSFADRVFFANSGAEANEAAIKLARKANPKGRYEIISLEGSFHGRTLATVAATGQPKFHQGFEPLPEGFRYAPFGDIAAMRALISPKTCAVLCEPLQGEGGVRPLDRGYLKAIRQLCDEQGLLLIFDEVQVGMGRTGSLFAYEQLGVTPDILTLAKALGNGFPIGAMLARESVAAAFEPGSHASTFGGNPVVCAAAVVVMKTLLEKNFLPTVKETGSYLQGRLQTFVEKYPEACTEVRGMGLIQGLALSDGWVSKGPVIVNRLFEKGALVNFAGNRALRFIPPLIVTPQEIDTLLAMLGQVFAELTS